MRAPTERPKVLLVFSIVSLLIAAAIGVIMYADQQRRIDDPVGYAERQCDAKLPGLQHATTLFEQCVQKEQSKSTLASILPFFIIGVIITLFGVAGVVIGIQEVRRQKEEERKRAEWLGQPPPD